MLPPLFAIILAVQIQLPDQLIKKKIGDMEVGEYSFAYAGAMQIDANGKCYLNPNEAVQKSMSPVLASIRLLRVKDGFQVELLDPTYKWDKKEIDLDGWLPVVKFNIRR